MVPFRYFLPAIEFVRALKASDVAFGPFCFYVTIGAEETNDLSTNRATYTGKVVMLLR